MRQVLRRFREYPPEQERLGGVHSQLGVLVLLLVFWRATAMSDQQKNPLPGEWWETRRGGRVYVYGLIPYTISANQAWPLRVITRGGSDIGLEENGTRWGEAESYFDLTRHLPGCTGWDWEEKTNE